MFNEVKSAEEVNAEKIIFEKIPVVMKNIIATSIYLAMKYAKRKVFNVCNCLKHPITKLLLILDLL